TGGTEELDRAPGCSRLDAEHPSPRQEPVLPQPGPVDDTPIDAVRPKPREDIAQQRVPPRRVIEHDDRRPAESRRRRSGLRDTYGVKVPGDVPASVAAEQEKQPRPARRQRPTREPVRAGGRGGRAGHATPPATTVTGPSRDGVMSRSRASAAI